MDIRQGRVLGASVVIGLALGGCSSAPPTPLEEALADARAATERYADEAVALEDGFVPAGECVQAPEGAMGVHYIHLDRAAQPPSLESPAFLLYMPEADGSMRLAGIEYFQPVIVDGVPYIGTDAPPAEAVATPPAEVFPGVAFDGPMPPHEPGMPWHWDLHVWLYDENPSGTFEPFNPSLHCPTADLAH